MTSEQIYKAGDLSNLFSNVSKKQKKKKKDDADDGGNKKLLNMFTAPPQKIHIPTTNIEPDVETTGQGSFEKTMKKSKKSKNRNVDQERKSEGFDPPPGMLHESLQKTSSTHRDMLPREMDDSDEEIMKHTDRTQQRMKRKKQMSHDKDEKAAQTIFIGNVPLQCKKVDLLKMFKKFGKIENVRYRCAPTADPKLPKKVVTLTKDFHDNRSNIVSYICYADVESAKKACGMNGHVVNNHHLRVDVAGDAKKHDKTRSVFVGNLPFNIEEDSVRKHFEECGEVNNVRIIRDGSTGIGKGFCYISFKNKATVELALKLHESKLQTRKLRVERAVEGKRELKQKCDIERRKQKKVKKKQMKRDQSTGKPSGGAKHSEQVNSKPKDKSEVEVHQRTFDPEEKKKRHMKTLQRKKDKRKKDKKLKHKIIAKKLGVKK